MPTDSPNFLVVLVDQMRADHMGPDGNPAIKTPNLDRLASGGVNLSRAYVNCPLCMPCRSTLFTGRTPRGHGVRTNGIPLDTAIPTLPQALVEAGYATSSVGKVHLNNFWFSAGITGRDLSPEANPELHEHWASGALTAMPQPYYGLQRCQIALGHGAGVVGDYANWLRQHHPEVHRAIHVDHQPPGNEDQLGVFPGPPEAHHSAWVADQTLGEIDRLHSGDRPFYLMCSFPDPHHPYHPPAPYDTMYDPADVVPPVGREGELDELAPFVRQTVNERLPLAGTGGQTGRSEEVYRRVLAAQYGQISLLDHQLGRVLDHLEQRGLAENTVVVFASDHGDLMGDHGLMNKGPFHFEGLLRVPMIWRWPGQFSEGRSSPALASLLDFVPTALDLAGLDPEEALAGPRPAAPVCDRQGPTLPGRSLAPLLRGQAESVQESVVIENDEDYLGLRLRTLVTDRHKITTYTSASGPEPFGELFDLQADPDELYNLWDVPEHRTLREGLTVQLMHRLTQTDSTLPRRLSHA